MQDLEGQLRAGALYGTLVFIQHLLNTYSCHVPCYPSCRFLVNKIDVFSPILALT